MHFTTDCRKWTSVFYPRHLEEKKKEEQRKKKKPDEVGQVQQSQTFIIINICIYS